MGAESGPVAGVGGVRLSRGLLHEKLPDVVGGREVAGGVGKCVGFDGFRVHDRAADRFEYGFAGPADHHGGQRWGAVADCAQPGAPGCAFTAQVREGVPVPGLGSGFRGAPPGRWPFGELGEQLLQSAAEQEPLGHRVPDLQGDGEVPGRRLRPVGEVRGQARWIQRYERCTVPAERAPGLSIRCAPPVWIRPGTALDLGCGNGDDALWLARRGWQVTAVDISHTAVARLRNRARGCDRRVIAEQHDLARSFPAGAYDLISAQYLHTPFTLDRANVLRTAAHALAPGGLLLIVDHGSTAP